MNNCSQTQQPMRNIGIFQLNEPNNHAKNEFHSKTTNPLITPRSPLVHLFICDYGNTKVQMLTTSFLKALTQNGINVFLETFEVHQPGYIVRAASINTQCDFFFQIQSKTVTTFNVRFFYNNQPKKMPMNQAIGCIWSWWRLKCGCLMMEETDMLSNDKILYLFKEFANIEPHQLNIEELQIKARSVIDNDENSLYLINELKSLKMKLNEGKNEIFKYKTISSEWKFEKGTIFKRLPNNYHTNIGLSKPLKDIMTLIISKTVAKIDSLINILFENLSNRSQNDEDIQIGSFDDHQSENSWQSMLDSLDDHGGSMHISSFGEASHNSLEVMQTQTYKLTIDFLNSD